MPENELLADVWARIDPSVPKPRLTYSILVGLMAGVGGLSFGYDLGVLASIFQMEQFVAFINLPEQATNVAKANIGGLFNIGCTIGSLLQGFASDHFGRKWSIIYGSVIATVGSLIQTFAQDLAALFVGRFITGLAIGMFSALVPVYMSETVIFTFRGKMVTSQQFMIVLGVLSAYITDYFCYVNYKANDWQWRGPLFAQVLLGVFLLVGVLPLPRSPRWLLSKGREEEALQSLSKLRMLPAENEYVKTEFDEMKWARQRELEIGTAGYMEILRDPPLQKRVLVISIINGLQQLCGINGVNYYAPKIYDSLGVGSTQMTLMLQIFYGLLKLIMTIPTFFIVDRFGRRPLFFYGSIVMTISMVTLAVIFGVYTNGVVANVKSVLAQHAVVGWVGVGAIWFFVVGFNASWGPMTWVVSSEVFPLRVRSKAISITATTQWFFNTVIVYIVPIWLGVHTYGIFVFLAICSFLSLPFVYFFLPETKNRTLEEMDIVWGVKRPTDIEVAVTDDEKKIPIIDAPPADAAPAYEEKDKSIQEESAANEEVVAEKAPAEESKTEEKPADEAKTEDKSADEAKTEDKPAETKDKAPQA